MLRFIAIGYLFWGTTLVANAKISSSFTVIDYWVGKLINEPAVIHQTIIPSGGEMHGYQISPSDSLKLAKSSVIIGLNPHSEPWLDDWAKANGRLNSVVWINQEHQGVSHSWMSPAISKSMVKTLHKALMSRKLTSENHLYQLLTEIDDVDKKVAEVFASIPKTQRIIITQHPSLSAFAEAFELEVAGSILDNSEAESADPSAQKYSQLLKIIKNKNIQVITCDAGQNSRVAQQLAKDAKINPPLPLTVEYLEKKGVSGDTWPTMMMNNAQKISEALRK